MSDEQYVTLQLTRYHKLVKQETPSALKQGQKLIKDWATVMGLCTEEEEDNWFMVSFLPLYWNYLDGLEKMI